VTDATQERLAGFIIELRGELRTIDVRLSCIEATLATRANLEFQATLSTIATKADLAKLESTMLKWFVGTALTLPIITSGIAFAIAKLVH
jgi:hypothetical protein